jgi:hypothetical protein
LNKGGVSKNMRYFFSSRAILGFSLALAFAPLPAFAEAAPNAASTDSSAPTRVEFTAMSRSLPLKPDDLPKGVDPMTEMKSKATQEALAKAIKLAGDFAAQYPKCRFRIASVAPDAPIPNDPTPPDAATMRVTLLGDAGCLPPGK